MDLISRHNGLSWIVRNSSRYRGCILGRKWDSHTGIARKNGRDAQSEVGLESVFREKGRSEYRLGGVSSRSMFSAICATGKMDLRYNPLKASPPKPYLKTHPLKTYPTNLCLKKLSRKTSPPKPYLKTHPPKTHPTNLCLKKLS